MGRGVQLHIDHLIQAVLASGHLVERELIGVIGRIGSQEVHGEGGFEL